MNLIAQSTRSVRIHSLDVAQLITILRLSMTFTLKICGYHSSAIQPISTHPPWRFTRQAMPGGLSVGQDDHVQLNALILLV
jgi:hypothetical protein